MLDIIRKSREETSAEDVDTVLGLYRQTKALEFAETASRELIDKAYGLIDDLPLDVSGKTLFRRISQFMVDRQT